MIYAYESVYCGLHGINTGGVFEVDSVAEADDIGKGMAYDVIDGYSHAFEDYDLEEVEEGIEWEVWPVRDNTGLSVSELAVIFQTHMKCFFLFMKKELMMIFFGLVFIMICPLRIILIV